MEVCRKAAHAFLHNKPMDTNRFKAVFISEGLMGLLLGLLLLSAGVWMAGQLHIVWNIWPSTDGVVLGGSIVEVVDIPSAKGGGAYYSYTPQIEFRYTVEGKQYNTTAPSVYSANTMDRAMANYTRLYKPGSHHPLRYNPRNPAEIQFGVIEFGPLALAFVFLVMGSLLGAIGINAMARSFASEVWPIPAGVQASPANVLDFARRSSPEPAGKMVICPSCGRAVKASEDNCPNCLRGLRAA